MSGTVQLPVPAAGSERPAGRSASGEAGMTLVELMVVLGLTGLVLALVSGGAIGLMRATNQVDVRTENVDNARLAVAALSRDVRAATPFGDDPAFVVASPFYAEFHARIGDGDIPVRIRIEVDGSNQVVERVIDPTVAPDGVVSYTTDPRRRYVASFLHNDQESADEPMLRFGQLIDGEVVWLEPTVPQTVRVGDDGEERVIMALSESARRSVRVVELDLRIARDQERRVGAQRVRTEVRVPNQRDGS